jgi:hypothetical protein
MRSRPTPAWAWTVLGTWAALVLLVGSLLLGRHLIALPRPQLGSVTARAWSGLRGPADRGRWLAIHVLYGGCPCSARIVDHLLQAPRLPTVGEVVLWVGRDPDTEARLSASGLRVVDVDAQVLQDRFGIEAAPLLIVLDQQDRARYLGGYTARKQGPDIQDRRILSALLAGALPEPNPVLGCAVSARLAKALNPAGLP